MLKAAVRSGQTLLVLSDYDGTLVPVVDDPSEAWPPREVAADLRLLAESARIYVAIISGRALDDLRARIALPGAIYAGCHGLEIKGPGIAFSHPVADGGRHALASMAETLRQRTATLSGVVVEPKGLAVSVHYRKSALADLPRLQAVLDAALRGNTWLCTMNGPKALEILPTRTWNSGQCALRIRDHVQDISGGNVTTVYFGGDAAELAFWALGDTALTVKVGRLPATHAACRLSRVDDVHRVLSALAAETGAGV